ncbi:MAG: helix-turn-helix domain-containing protein [Candidatus Cybelea sp.]
MENHGRKPSSDFGGLLRRYRLAAGLSQETLAERARLSPYGISALERGYRLNPQRETLELLSGALALNAEERRAFEAAAARPSRPRRRGSGVTVGPWPSATSALLPLALTRLVGRDQELREIAELLDEHRFVTLTGSGGIGKTQTALRAASAASDNFETVYFAALASIDDPSLVTVAIAYALGVQAVPNHPLIETLTAFLRHKAVLLVLDNCEHVVTEAAVVAEALLAGCPGIRVLATSREPLMAGGERTYRLPSLALEDAVALFSDRAQAVDHRFILKAENAPPIAEICRRLDGIPLAIELAACRVSALSVQALLAKLDYRFRILAGGRRTALPRHQTMRAAIDWSYDLLASGEQRLFERLSVFAGSYTLSTAAAVCASDVVIGDEVLALLSSLVEKSLVATSLEANEPRYRLLESFREYAREKLSARDEHQAFARRHALTYVKLAKQANDGNLSDFGVTPLTHSDVSDLRAALEWALTNRGDVLVGQRLAGEISIWDSFQHTDGRRWTTRALELADDSTPDEIVAALSFADAYIGNNLRHHAATLASSEAALAYYRDAGDANRTVWALGLAAEALCCLNRRAEAKALLDESLPLAQTLKGRDRLAYAHILRTLPRACGIEIEETRRHIGEAVQIYDELGDAVNVVHSLNDLSESEFRAGNADLALRCTMDVLAMSRSSRLEWTAARVWALNYASLYLVSLGRYDEGAQRAREALSLARELHWDHSAAWALENLAEIAVLRREALGETAPAIYAPAAQVLGFAQAQFESLGSVREPVTRPQYEQVIHALRAALGPERAAELMGTGAGMSDDEAAELGARL